MRWTPFSLPLALVVAFAATRAPAVIPAPEKTVAKLHERAPQVLIGRVTVLSEENFVATAHVQTIKGDAAPNVVKFQLPRPEGLFAKLAKGSPFVLVTETPRPGPLGTLGALHIGDQWVIVQLMPNPNAFAWRFIKEDDGTLHAAYPGYTQGLVRVMAQIKAGSYLLLDAMEPKIFPNAPRQIARLPVANPTFFAAADANGDKRVDLVVGTEQGVKFFLATDKGYQDATQAWGLAGAKGAKASFGDVKNSGLPALLIDTTLYLNDGQRFTAVTPSLPIPAGAELLAIGAVDVTGEARADVAILTKTGECHTFISAPGAATTLTTRPVQQLWKDGPPPLAAAFGNFGETRRAYALVAREDGITRYALDPREGGPTEFSRFTGEKIDQHDKNLKAMKNVRLVPLDYNADQSRDLLVLSDTGGFMLYNRGFGVFFVSPDAAVPFVGSATTKPSITLPPGALIATADLAANGRDGVLVLAPDGRLMELPNPPPPAE